MDAHPTIVGDFEGEFLSLACYRRWVAHKATTLVGGGRMKLSKLSTNGHDALAKLLGYLNFSSGKSDPQIFAHLNQIYDEVLAGRDMTKSKATPEPVWKGVSRLLRDKLAELRQEGGAFAEAQQSQSVLDLVTDQAIPAYRQFHRDLLGHHADDFIFNSFMFGRICEVVLGQGPPWDESERITSSTIARLNDYIGYRPVPALETRKLEPYANEWTRPIPVYIQHAGVATGPYRALIERAIHWLGSTNRDLLHEAHFDLEKMAELAIDPRAFDFEHPVNKRPNYHFGQWDPHAINHHGFYCRFVVQQVTLDALMARVEQEDSIPQEQRLDEAAAVLGGTILMASGISGEGPDAHDSTVNLAHLLPPIASYRDRYYFQLLDLFPSEHAGRLREEAIQLHQPFGGVRQHLNNYLSRTRATLIERVHLANMYARMGYPEAAKRQTGDVHVASSRMLCQIDCHLTAAKQNRQRGKLEVACDELQDATNLLHRAIACGAVVDPWNILGFDGNFSLFPALENTVRDHRVDELVHLIEGILTAHANVWEHRSGPGRRANMRPCFQAI